MEVIGEFFLWVAGGIADNNDTIHLAMIPTIITALYLLALIML